MTWDQFEKNKQRNTSRGFVFPKFSLAEHDKKYHPHGFKHGDHCKLRETFEKHDEADMIEPENEKTLPKQVRAVNAMKRLATKWHAGAYRRGPEHLMYIVHPTAVVKTLKDWGYDAENDPVTMGVAWGHDLVEDTKVPEKEIVNAGNAAEAGLGDEILKGIKSLSFQKPEGIVSHEEFERQKDAYLQKIADTAPAEILAVKIADRLNNAMDFAKDKNHWGKTYLAKGERFFKRVGELKNPEAVQKTIDEVKTAVAAIQEPPPKPKHSAKKGDDYRDEILPLFELDEYEFDNDEIPF